MRDGVSMLYEWLRDHGQVIGSVITGLFTAMVFALGLHVRREQKWRDDVERQLALIMPKHDVERMFERVERDRVAQIAALAQRMDRADAHIDRRFAELRQAQSEDRRLVRSDIKGLARQISVLIEREMDGQHRDGPQR